MCQFWLYRLLGWADIWPNMKVARLMSEFLLKQNPPFAVCISLYPYQVIMQMCIPSQLPLLQGPLIEHFFIFYLVLDSEWIWNIKWMHFIFFLNYHFPLWFLSVGGWVWWRFFSIFLTFQVLKLTHSRTKFYRLVAMVVSINKYIVQALQLCRKIKKC